MVVEPRELVNEFLFRDFHRHIPGGGRMMDLGSGTGHSIVRFGDRFDSVLGVVSGFDFVTAIGCFHHLPPETFDGLLQRIFDCLEPGGRLLIADPIQVDLSLQPGEIARWNATSVAAGLAFTSDAEEADEAQAT